jgi:hypothetical protein
MDEYPEDKLEKARKKFISKAKDAIEERKETTRNRIIGGYCLLGFLLLVIILIAVGLFILLTGRFLNV